MNVNRNISIIGVPMDLGQSRRGVDMGPSAVRYAGMKERLLEIGYEVKDLGDITVDHTLDESEGQLKNLNEIARVSDELAATSDGVIKEGNFPLIVGGDHSIAIGSLAGISRNYENLGVIWYDAHGDLNTPETSPSGNIHGMPLAASLGIGHKRLVNLYAEGAKIKPENLVIIGARSLDPGEKELIREKGIRVYTMHEVDRMGMPAVIDEAIGYLKERTDGLHLSLDLDGLDPSEAPGVGTPVMGGMTYRESHLAMEMIHESGMLTSAEFVEVNPILDDRNRTADLAVGLMGSLFGEKLK
ncbi:arginase [Aciduricibacillus chroicocephali]|uniref:Arginase n=1 Tax=Aciduricibacillus chroicocephali TaxID=3054939 RepID=A0ABY9KW79_9BACI|nr:arginase [Bacillaceae bacterium 44XB]